MLRQTYIVAASLAILITCASESTPGQETQPGRNDAQQKVLTGDALAKARQALRDYTFKNRDIGEAFESRNKEVVAVVLELSRSGNEVVEIKVYSSTRKDSRLKPVKTLKNKADPDFKTLIDKLKL
jgi:hypothetical protein